MRLKNFLFSVFSIVTSFPWLLFARSLQGIASSSIAVAGMGMIANLYEDDEERSGIMGVVMGGIATGVLIGYPLGGFLYDFVGESSPFIILFIASGIIWGRLIWRFGVTSNQYFVPWGLISGLQFKIIEVNKPSQNEYEEEFETVGYGKLFQNPKILVATGAICISTSAMALLEPCLPIWLMDTIHPEVYI